jgi:hypothetical protein
MIQRIQSIYLLIAASLLGGSYALPFAHANVAPSPTYQPLPATNAFADGFLQLTDSQLGLGCIMIAAIFSIIAIFRYQSRLRQLTTSWVAILGALIGLGAMGFEYITDKAAITSAAAPDLGGLLPLAGILFIFLAIRAIRKDEALVKSMDRLR